MKLGIIFGLFSFLGQALATPAARQVQLPAEFKWIADILNSAKFGDAMQKCHGSIDVLTKDNLYDKAFAVDSECINFNDGIDNLNKAFASNRIPAGTKPETLDLVLQYLIETKLDARVVSLLTVLSKQEPLLNQYFGVIGWTWFRPDDMRFRILTIVKGLDQFVRHNLGTTAFFDAPQFPAYVTYFEGAWAAVAATKSYKPTEGPLPVIYEEAVQWDVSEKRRALYAAVASVKAYKDKSGLKAIIATGKSLATKVGGWYTNGRISNQGEPSLELTSYRSALEGASVAESRLRKYEIPTYQPLLFPLVDALVEKKPLFASLSDAEKKELDTVIDSIWAAWTGRDNRIIGASATIEAPAYTEALASGSKIYQAYGKWKA